MRGSVAAVGRPRVTGPVARGEPPFTEAFAEPRTGHNDAVSLNSVEPMSPQEYSRGMVKRAVIGGVILVIGVIPLIMAGNGGIWDWVAEPFAGTTRSVIWLVLMVIIEGLLMVTYVMKSARRVAAWRRQRGDDPTAR